MRIKTTLTIFLMILVIGALALLKIRARSIEIADNVFECMAKNFGQNCFESFYFSATDKNVDQLRPLIAQISTLAGYRDAGQYQEAMLGNYDTDSEDVTIHIKWEGGYVSYDLVLFTAYEKKKVVENITFRLSGTKIQVEKIGYAI